VRSRPGATGWNGGCCAAEVNITPSSQTLILAGEQVPQSAKPGVSAGQGHDAAPSGAVLRRVTMLTAWPDSTLVYVRADYAPPANPSPDNVVAIQPKSIVASAHTGISEGAAAGTTLVAQPRRYSLSVRTHSRDVNGNPQSPSGGGGLSTYLKPEEQYAQTQRILAGEPRTSHLDVHA